MNPNSAFRLIKIQPGNDYSDHSSTVFALHCTKTNTTPVKLKLQGDQVYTEFPPESFIHGAVYALYIKMLAEGSDVEFIGYVYEQKPFSL